MEAQAEQLRLERARLESALAEREHRLNRLQTALSAELLQASALFREAEARSVELYRQQLLFRYANNDAEVLRFLDAQLARLERRRATL